MNEISPVCNGNGICNGFHEDASSSDYEPQEAPVSSTLVFYVNGKEVRQPIYRYRTIRSRILNIFCLRDLGVR